ncbi:MAG: 50S ribosomal protein L29 [Nitrospirae bacterium]|nr:MAG: 50S ribosomal protein L29 [Nitrospirota bacterium]
MKAADIREMGPEELAKKEQEMRKELFNLRFQKATGEIENPMRIRTIRKDIARVLTAMTQRGQKK